MLSHKWTFSLQILIVILVLGVVASSAMAEFGVAMSASSDISTEPGVQASRTAPLTINIRFDRVVSLGAADSAFSISDFQVIAYNEFGGTETPPGIFGPNEVSPRDGRNYTVTLNPPSSSVTRVLVLLAAHSVELGDPRAELDADGNRTDAGKNAEASLTIHYVGADTGFPQVYSIEKAGGPSLPVTAETVHVNILLSEKPGAFTRAHVDVTNATWGDPVAVESIPETGSMPATGRDNRLYPYVLTITPNYENRNAIVVKVRAFSDLTGRRSYTPPRTEAAYVEGQHKLTVRVGSDVNRPVQAAGTEVILPPNIVIPSGGYLIVAANEAGSNIIVPAGDKSRTPAASDRKPAQLLYNVIVADLPNLETLLTNGATIDLIAPADVYISEIMWGSDARLATSRHSQWIELQNIAGRELRTGNGSYKLVFYGAGELPSISTVKDRVGTIGSGGYWSVTSKGQSGQSTAQALISMQRVVSATGIPTNGTLASSWVSSVRPAVNFREGLQIGTPGASPIRTPAVAVPVQPTAVEAPTPPGDQTTPVTTPVTVGEPFNFEIVGAAERTGDAVNKKLDSPLLVRVLDVDDNGIPNERVVFRITDGKGKLSVNQGPGRRSIAAETDPGGYARADFTPTAKGTATVEARTTGLEETVEFTIQTGTTTPTTPTTTPGTTPGTVTPPSTPVSPVVHVGAAKRLPMLWVSEGKIYALVGADVERFAPSVDNALNIAVGDGNVYWTEKTGERGGTINSANLDGSDVQELTSIFATPMGIAVDVPNSKLYWTNSAGRIQSANLDGSGIKNVLSNLPKPMDITLTDSNAYWTQGNGSVRLVNLQGKKTIEDISTGAQAANSLVIGGGKVYWTEKTGDSAGTINSANLDGTGAKQLISIEASVPMGIAVDTERESIYWTNSRGRIQSANLDGSVVQNVAEGLGSPGDMVLSKDIKRPGGTSPQTPASKATYDINGDGTVDDTDATLITEAITNGSTDAKYDVNGDGKVNFDDLQLVLDNRDRSPYDINGDGTVDDTDASLITEAISNGSTDAKYDVNDDGKVNFDDLQLVLDNRAPGATGAPALLGMHLTAVQIDRLQEQIDLLIATGDRSPAAMRTLIYLQQLIATARPEKTQLLANYPNPFNPETWIPYELATDTDVRITIYNTQGVVIRTLQLGHQSAGYYTDRDQAAYWDGRNTLGEQVASGIYFYQFETDEMSSMRKMVILK